MTVVVARFTVDSRDSRSRTIEVVDPVLVVAGFTGRDATIVEQHIRELEAEGIPRPNRVPAVFVLANWLLLVAPETVEVASPHTSGEAEPVLIRMPSGELYLTVGSDHTDRALERMSFGAAKGSCPKVVADRVWPLAEVEDRWDDLIISSTLETPALPYQQKAASCLLYPHTTLHIVEEMIGLSDRPLVIFLGTVPLMGGLVCSSRFEARIQLGGHELLCGYGIRVFDPIDAAF